MAGKERRKKENKPKYYAFLDVVLDVFYSILLYNAFVAFPGWKLESLLMLLSLLIMLDYWWASRSSGEMPKYYLFDFYAITIIMFIFSQWPNYYEDITIFIYVMAIFFACDSLYSLISVFTHRETLDEPALWFYFVSELCLAIFYFLSTRFINEVSWTSIGAIFIPYLIVFALAFKRGLMKPHFIDYGNQPY